MYYHFFVKSLCTYLISEKIFLNLGNFFLSHLVSKAIHVAIGKALINDRVAF